MCLALPVVYGYTAGNFLCVHQQIQFQKFYTLRIFPWSCGINSGISVRKEIGNFYLSSSKIFKISNYWFWFEFVSHLVGQFNSVAKTNNICIFCWTANNFITNKTPNQIRGKIEFFCGMFDLS